MLKVFMLVIACTYHVQSWGASMEIKKYNLTNSKGMQVQVLNYGGIVSSIMVPDNKGTKKDVTLGFDNPEGYTQTHPYFGALIGRYGNRIAKGKFTLDGKDYSLAVNNGPNHLHGGLKGFDKVFWDVTEVTPGKRLKLNYVSKDMEEGYPGKLSVEVYYELTDNNELKINYSATTDKATPVNLTHHSYFNLSGDPAQTVLEHELMINADTFTEVDKDLTPTGKLVTVEGPMDFRKAKKIGTDLSKVDGGYDHNYVINKTDGKVKSVATLYHAPTGRLMEVLTNQPGIQFYSGNFLDGKLEGKTKFKYVKHGGLCLETQHFPDSPNHKNFPSTILRPGEKYDHQTIYKFSVR